MGATIREGCKLGSAALKKAQPWKLGASTLDLKGPLDSALPHSQRVLHTFPLPTWIQAADTRSLVHPVSQLSIQVIKNNHG